MPLYTFLCMHCNVITNHFMSMVEVPDIGDHIKLACSKCGNFNSRRILDGPPAIHKGAPVKKQKKEFDGFGYHDGLLMNFKGPKDYKEYLKKEGLVEAGNEPPPQAPPQETLKPDDAFIKGCIDSGLKVSDREANALKSGEYQKSKEFKQAMKVTNTNGTSSFVA